MKEIPADQRNKDIAEQELVLEILDVGNPDDDMCCICMDKPKDSIFYPCGHMVLCFGCAERFKKEARH